jgi:hypothetical protein
MSRVPGEVAALPASVRRAGFHSEGQLIAVEVDDVEVAHSIGTVPGRHDDVGSGRGSSDGTGHPSVDSQIFARDESGGIGCQGRSTAGPFHSRKL